VRAVLLLGLLSCATERTHGYYVEKATLDDKDDKNRVGWIKGENVVLLFGNNHTPPGCKSERMRQTDIWVELSIKPNGPTVVDLSKIKVRFQYGGQMLSFVSTSCKGTLAIRPLGDDLDAQLDITCDKPRIGEGEHSFAGDVTLTRHRL
jgi:hypothetical protein